MPVPEQLSADADTIAVLLADARLQRGVAITPPTGISAPARVDQFPSLAARQIHEWHSAEIPGQPNVWYPPLTLLTLLAGSRAAEGRLLWIGRRCWPTFQLLCALRGGELPRKVLERSIFLDPLTDAERFWSIAEGLRCAGIGCVIADGSGMSSTANRRLQLAAEGGAGIGLIARPPWEKSEPFCAATRWRVEPIESRSADPQWIVELQRCRGQRQDAPRRWTVAWKYRVHSGTGALHFSPHVGCGSAATEDRPHPAARSNSA